MAARDYKWFKSTLHELGGRETVVLRFGDHEPWIPGVLPGGDFYARPDPNPTKNQFFTFYALERIGGRLRSERGPGIVDIFALRGLLLKELRRR